jgi:hypothetical protein
VDGAGQDALAGSVLAGDEDGGIGDGHAGRDLENGAHRGRAARDLDVGGLLRQPPLQLLDLGGEVPLHPKFLEDVSDLRRGERFGQIVPGPAPHRLDRRLDGPIGGDEDQRQVGPFAQELG